MILIKDSQSGRLSRGLYKQIPHRRQDKREKEDKHPGDPQVAPDDRGKIVIVCLLKEIENRGRQEHDLRGVVADDGDASLLKHCRGGVRALGIADLRKGLYQPVFIRHSARLCWDILSDSVLSDDSFLRRAETSLSRGFPVNIAHYNVALCRVADGEFFGYQLRVAGVCGG